MPPFLIVAADNVPQAYRRTLEQLAHLGALVPCHGNETFEVIGATIRITDPTANICAEPDRRMNYRYMVGEMMWNLCNRADVAFLQSLSKGITKFVADQPETMQEEAAWAYGPSISHDLAGIISILQDHPETRRAVLRPGRHSFAGDRRRGTPPCLEVVEFLIRDGALHCVVFMRSNDAYLGMPYDMFTYTTWQQAIATALGVDVGTYTHQVGSLHYYLKDEEKVDQVIRHFDETALHLQSAPNILEAADGSLNADLDAIMRVQSEAPAYFAAKSWSPLLRVVTKEYSKCDGVFSTLKRSNIGVGW